MNDSLVDAMFVVPAQFVFTPASYLVIGYLVGDWTVRRQTNLHSCQVKD